MKSRASELADQIEQALLKEPADTGTKIEIQEGDWEIVVAGLRGRLDEARCLSIEEQLESLRIVVATLAAKIDLPDSELIAMLNDSLARVRAAPGGSSSQVH